MGSQTNETDEAIEMERIREDVRALKERLEKGDQRFNSIERGMQETRALAKETHDQVTRLSGVVEVQTETLSTSMRDFGRTIGRFESQINHLASGRRALSEALGRAATSPKIVGIVVGGAVLIAAFCGGSGLIAFLKGAVKATIRLFV